MKFAKLRNGSTEPHPIVIATKFAVSMLGPIAVYELVMRCRDSSHVLEGGVEPDLERTRLLVNGRIHSSAKNVILSMAVGEDMEMSFVDPVVEVFEQDSASTATSP